MELAGRLPRAIRAWLTPGAGLILRVEVFGAWPGGQLPALVGSPLIPV